MPLKLAKAILFSHQIPYREVNGWLQVEEVFTLHGKSYSVWVPCPDSRKALLSWIGY